MKKSYWKDGIYIDVTTNRVYTPKNYCEICGASFPLTVHHKLPQSKCLRDLKTKVKTPSTWTQEYIDKNQRLFTLCLDCHANVHNISKERFQERYHKDKDYFVTIS